MTTRKIFSSQTCCLLLAVLMLLGISPAYSAQSTVTEAEGYSCMGADKSRKQTEKEALIDAKRKAIESTITYIKSETQVKNFQLEKDIVAACSRARVEVLDKKELGWYKDESLGECFKVWIKIKVTPDDKDMAGINNEKQITDNPLYRGNSDSKVFHQRTCRYYNCKNCIATFTSKDDAVRAGYRACKLCSP